MPDILALGNGSFYRLVFLQVSYHESMSISCGLVSKFLVDGVLVRELFLPLRAFAVNFAVPNTDLL